MACGSPSRITVLAALGNSGSERLGEPVPPRHSGTVLRGHSTIVLAAAIIAASLGCNSAHTAHRVNLCWDPSRSADVVGYNVYRGTQSGGPYKKLNSSPVTGTEYTDSTVQAGHTFFYVVRAVDSRNVQSVATPEVSAAIPANTLLGGGAEVVGQSLKKLQEVKTMHVDQQEERSHR